MHLNMTSYPYLTEQKCRPLSLEPEVQHHTDDAKDTVSPLTLGWAQFLGFSIRW